GRVDERNHRNHAGGGQRQPQGSESELGPPAPALAQRRSGLRFLTPGGARAILAPRLWDSFFPGRCAGARAFLGHDGFSTGSAQYGKLLLLLISRPERQSKYAAPTVVSHFVVWSPFAPRKEVLSRSERQQTEPLPTEPMSGPGCRSAYIL